MLRRALRTTRSHVPSYEEDRGVVTKLVKVPKAILRAKRAEVASKSVEHTKLYDLRSPAPLAKPRPSPAALYLSSLAEGASRKTMMMALGKIAKILATPMGVTFVFVEDFPWHELDVTLVAGLRSRLQETCAPRSANLYLSGLRGVLKACASLGLMTYEEMHRALDGAKSVRGHTEPAGRALSREDVEAMFKVCDRTTGIGLRDAALLTLLFGCGMRRAEVAAVHLKNLTLMPKTASLLVRGKGRKERTVSLSANAFAIIQDWLKFRGDDPGPLLLTCDEKESRGMSLSTVYTRVVQLAQRAGIEHVSPHDLRRTLITDLLADGVDAFTVSKWVGHSQIQTTLGYDRREEKRKQEAEKRFHEDRFASLGVKKGKKK